MEWKDVGNTVATIAPTLGKVIGGIVGGPEIGTLAGNAISGLFGLFGLKPDSTPDQLNEAIAKDPQSALKLRQSEMEYNLALNKQKLDEQDAFLRDIQNARNMMVETTKATGKRDVNLYALAWVIVVGFFSLTCLLIFRDVPKDSNGVIFMLFGALVAGFGSVVGYFFGSSKSSADKTELIAKAGSIK